MCAGKNYYKNIQVYLLDVGYGEDRIGDGAQTFPAHSSAHENGGVNIVVRIGLKREQLASVEAIELLDKNVVQDIQIAGNQYRRSTFIVSVYIAIFFAPFLQFYSNWDTPEVS